MVEWTEMQEAKDNLASSMADIETNYTQAMENLGVIMDEGNENIQTSTVDLANGVGQNNKNLKDEFITTYDRMMVGANDIIVAKTPTVVTSATVLVSDTITAMETELNVVDGKSLKAQTVAVSVVDGFAQGILNGTATVTKAFQTMVNNSITNADFSGFKSAIDKMLGDALD